MRTSAANKRGCRTPHFLHLVHLCTECILIDVSIDDPKSADPAASASGSADRPGPRHDLRAEKAERTRALIHSSAMRLAAERGYDAMTIDEVAADAGVSRRTVFNYFPAKADLVLLGPTVPPADAVEAFAASTGDLLDDLGELMKASEPRRREDAEDFRLFRRLLRETPELTTALQARLREYADAIRSALARRFNAPIDDPRVIAAYGLAQGIQKAAIDLWAGASHRACEAADGPSSEGAAANERAGGSLPSSGPAGPDLVDESAAHDSAEAPPSPTEEPDAPYSVAEGISIIISSLREVLAARPDAAPADPRSETQH